MLDSLLSLVSNVWFIFIGLIALGSCIFVHELGHFLAARKRGLKVERFSIGFGPRIRGWTKDGVDYRLSAIPFGGYVALPQLADMGSLEGGGEDGGEQQLPPISYADKMIVSVMGAVFNVIFAAALSLILWTAGQEVPVSSQSTLVGYVSETLITDEGDEVAAPAFVAGVQPGDIITHVDGAPIDNWGDLSSRIVTGVLRTEYGNPLTKFTIDRDGETINIDVIPILASRESVRQVGVSSASALQVGTVAPEKESILSTGDPILEFNGEKVFTWMSILEFLKSNPEGGLPFTIATQSGIQEVIVEANLIELENDLFTFELPKTTLFSQTVRVYPDPITQFANKMEMMYLTLRGLLSKNSDVKVRNLSGPVGIVDNFQMFARIGVIELLWLLVFVNINLAIMNLLPIPVLDGGHMMFATIAKITGRPIPRQFLEGTQAAFAILLFSFMIYVTFFDVGRIFDRVGN
ncbi:MAG: RIP metalloprotease RseP [Opitutales bacterium]|nr:RIP metalloprotease RseP [Opitutales bacterium]NRA26776.1 RIP metalloprotease RseP [Opitutales bacterium]